MPRMLPAVAALLLPLSLTAQTANSTSTIQVTSRIVYVDVIVRNSAGQIVHGLAEDDFRILEDGKPQAIDYFAAHSYQPPVPGEAAPAPSHTGTAPAQTEFSNVSNRGESAGAINIILFDLANTPAVDQPYAKHQLLEFLSALPPGQQVALFILSDRLHMIQNFTQNSDQLREAAQQINPQNFNLIASKSESMQEVDTFAGFAKATNSAAIMRMALANARLDAAIGADTRARITLAALNELANATGGYTGRKNLLWLSESFPLAVGAQVNETKYEGVASLPGSRETANALANAQMSVYPISLLGLETGGVGAETSGAAETSAIGGPADPLASILNPTMGGTLKSQFQARQLLKEQMNDLAGQTGGEAFVGTNGFAGALRRSMIDGSNYYTLAYRPTNQKWNGQFRKIRVELKPKGDSLTYRSGYFAYPDNSSTQNPVQKLNAALQPGTPDSTMLILHSTVDLPGAQRSGVLVHSVLNAASLHLPVDADGHRRGKLLVMLVAFNGNSAKPEDQPEAPAQTSGILNLDLDPAQYQNVQANGLAFTQQLSLRPGAYMLRLGVADLNSGHLGTLDMPTTIP